MFIRWSGLIEWIKLALENREPAADWWINGCFRAPAKDYREIRKRIENLPAAVVRKCRRGYWISDGHKRTQVRAALGLPCPCEIIDEL